MSAIARYFKFRGLDVAGYDRTATPLTHELEREGIAISYEDREELIPEEYRDPLTTLLVYTPAIPQDSPEKLWFMEHGFTLHKRAEVLGLLSNGGKALCVAGTHGKTTTTTLLAYLLDNSTVGCSAFLGGISRNYGTNLLQSSKSEYIVVEADEFDRSFLHLTPYIAAITAMDADHLDIYGTKEAMQDAFAQYASQVRSDGRIIVKSGLESNPRFASMPLPVESYGVESPTATYHTENLRIVDGLYEFDYIGCDLRIEGLRLGIPGRMNVENATLAITMALRCGATPEEIRVALPNFKGVERRFNIHAVAGEDLYADDYAHHPAEIAATISLVREMWCNKPLTIIFQPHLYTRTRDLYKEFAESLNRADRVILTDIYPAREEPIPGITSEIILERLTIPAILIPKERVVEYLRENFEGGVVVTVGAGNIDTIIPDMAAWMRERGEKIKR